MYAPAASCVLAVMCVGAIGTSLNAAPPTIQLTVNGGAVGIILSPTILPSGSTQWIGNDTTSNWIIDVVLVLDDGPSPKAIGVLSVLDTNGVGLVVDLVVDQPLSSAIACKTVSRLSATGVLTAPQPATVQSTGLSPMVEATIDGVVAQHLLDSPQVASGSIAVLGPLATAPMLSAVGSPVLSTVGLHFAFSSSSGVPGTAFAVTGSFLAASPDLNGDGTVDGSDLGLLLGGWGVGGPADLDFDGSVGPSDLSVLLASWGPCTC